MQIPDDIEKIRVKVVESIKTHLESSPDQENAQATMEIVDLTSRVCAWMLIEYSNLLLEEENDQPKIIEQ
jgi:hypothetical protein